MGKAKTAYVGLIVLFLYAPIFVLIAQSFNASRYRGHWTGFTTQWYASLLEDEDMLAAFLNTLSIGLTAALCATLLGLATALALRAMGHRTRMTVRGLANVPLLNADIVTGISLMLLFLGLGLRLGYDTILLAHIVICLPYALLCILPQVLGLDRVYYEAAVDLGATPCQAFRKVLLPELYPVSALPYCFGLPPNYSLRRCEAWYIYYSFHSGKSLLSFLHPLTNYLYKQVPLSVSVHTQHLPD